MAPRIAQRIVEPRLGYLSMARCNLSWLDKTILALGRLAVGEVRSNIHVMRIALSISLLVSLSSVYRIVQKGAGIVGPLPSLSKSGIIIPLIVLGLCYLSIYFTTHSASEIKSVDLSGWKRWSYTALGLFIFPLSWLVWGFLLFWLEG